MRLTSINIFRNENLVFDHLLLQSFLLILKQKVVVIFFFISRGQLLFFGIYGGQLQFVIKDLDRLKILIISNLSINFAILRGIIPLIYL